MNRDVIVVLGHWSKLVSIWLHEFDIFIQRCELSFYYSTWPACSLYRRALVKRNLEEIGMRERSIVERSHGRSIMNKRTLGKGTLMRGNTSCWGSLGVNYSIGKSSV